VRQKISAREFLADLRDGLSDTQLREKYGLSEDQLDKILNKLVDAGRITKQELDSRKVQGGDILSFNAPPETPNPVISVTPSHESTYNLADQGGQPSGNQSSTSQGYQQSPEREVLSTCTRNAWIGISAGLFLTVFGLRLGGIVDRTGILSILFMLGGVGLYIWGCYYLVKRKGYRGAFALWGLLAPIGLLMLLLLPNKYSPVGHPVRSAVAFRVWPAILSLFVPGLGQMVQGRILAGLLVSANVVLYLVPLFVTHNVNYDVQTPSLLIAVGVWLGSVLDVFLYRNSLGPRLVRDLLTALLVLLLFCGVGLFGTFFVLPHLHI
jgi:hypothetical protein